MCGGACRCGRAAVVCLHAFVVSRAWVFTPSTLLKVLHNGV